MRRVAEARDAWSEVGAAVVGDDEYSWDGVCQTFLESLKQRRRRRRQGSDAHEWLLWSSCLKRFWQR